MILFGYSSRVKRLETPQGPVSKLVDGGWRATTHAPYFESHVLGFVLVRALLINTHASLVKEDWGGVRGF